MYTPWGESQEVTMISRGASIVSTESHGGIALTDSYARKNCLPDKVLRIGIHAGKHYWFEEDCDYAVPLYFCHDLRTDYYYRMKEEGAFDMSMSQLEQRLRHVIERWHPELLEAN